MTMVDVVCRSAGAALLLAAGIAAQGDTAGGRLPPPPVPKENPTTAAKAVLGKALFWDEQLSSDGSMACGTCHRPAAGGSDPRVQRHPGPDGKLLTDDDALGSPGMLRPPRDSTSLLADLFDAGTQVTARTAPSNLTAAYAPELFWDGRAGGTFRDPVTGTVVIRSGGALESQSLVPILSTTEMSRQPRTWTAVVERLARVRPLQLASALPPDLARAVARSPSYPGLFAEAFGDAAITPVRIAFALAAYQRTLVPDQTPYDRYLAGDRTALTDNQREGLDYFRRFRCATCHTPPLFTDHSYRNIGLRPDQEDPGRGAITGEAADQGRFRVPSLRNVGLKPRLMHNGRFPTLTSILRVYRFPNRYPNLDPLLQRGIPVNHRANDSTPMLDFLKNALTDPRVARAAHPFDRPRLRSERQAATGTGKGR